MRCVRTTLLAAALVLLPLGHASAQHGAVIGGYYAQSLKASFLVGPVSLPNYGTFTAARIVSTPAWDSPLNGLSLTMGDVITRLDGIPVTNNYELDRHYSWTAVRYIKQGTTYPVDGHIFIGSGGMPPGGGGAPPP